MARKKLNTKFLIILAVAVGLLVAAAFLARPVGRMLFRSIAKLEAEGDSALKAGDYEAAAESYGKAASRDRNNVPIQLKFVDAYDYTVQGDPEKLSKLRQFLGQIVANDPRSVPALERVLRFQLNDVRGNPADGASVRALANTAERIVKIDPTHVEARKAQISVVLEPHSRNLTVDPAEVQRQREAAVALNEELQGKDGEVVRMVALFHLVAAQSAARQGEPAEVKSQLEQARTFIDAAVQRTPENALAWMARYNTYLATSILTPGLSQEDRQAAQKAASESLTQADAHATPAMDEDNFLHIRSTALRALELRDAKLAEERYRRLVTELPGSRQPRIMLADFLAKQPTRLEDAIAVLEQQWQPSAPLQALDSRQQSFYKLIEDVRLCTIRLAALDRMTDAAAREKRLGEVEKLYADLSSNTDAARMLKPALMRIDGGIDLERGRVAEGLSQLDAALKLISPDAGGSFDQELRNDLLLEYAQAQLKLGQTGVAKPALTELVGRRPDHLAARALLTDLLINEQDYAEASKHVDFLQRVLPGNPMVERMAIRLLRQRPEQLREQYARMPEGTRDERLVKVYAAANLGNADETLRLARLMLESDPADDEAATLLVQTLLRANKPDEARAALETARNAKPESERLQTLAAALAAETPEQRQALMGERIDEIEDPYRRELARSEFLRSQGKIDEAVAALEAARASNPKDSRAPDALFRLMLAQRKFDEAEKLLPTLSELSADLVGGAIRRIELDVAKAFADTDTDRRTVRLQDAVARAAQLVQQYRELAAASLFHAQLLQQTGDFQAAAEQFAQTLDKAPTNLDALRGSIESLMALNRGADARRRLDQARALAPDDARLRELELNYELNFGDPLRAIDALQEAVTRNPDNPQVWAQLGGALEQVARVKERAGDKQAAEQFAIRAADHYGKAYEKFPGELRFAVQRSELLRRAGRNADAEKLLTALAAREDLHDRPEVTEVIAEQFARAGRADEAERVLREFIARAQEKKAEIPASTVLRLSSLFAQTDRGSEAMAVLDLRKDHPDVKRQRIELLLAAGQVDAAREAIDEAIATHPTPDIYLVAAFVELRTGRPERAEGFITKVLQERPNDPAALLGRAQVAVARETPDLDAARDDLVRVREMAPGHSEAALLLAEVYQRQRQRDEALRTLERAWRANPTSKQVLMRLADLYATSQPARWTDLQTAIAAARQSPQLAGDPDVMLLEAGMWISRNDMTKAQQLARQALAVAPTNAELRNRYFDTLIRARAHREVLKETEPMLAEDPKAWWLHRLRGIAYRRLDQKVDAQKEFDKAFNLVTATGDEGSATWLIRTIAQEIDTKTAIAMTEPLANTSLGYRLLLASLHQSANNAQPALEELERIIAERDKLRPEQLRQALQMLGSAYLQATPPQPAKARAVYEELHKQTPNDVLTLNNLAYVLTLPESGGTPAEALKYSQRSYDLSNQMGIDEATLYVWDTHGWVLVKNGRINDGLDLLRRAAETAKFPDVHLHLAEAYLMAEDPQSASLALSEAEKLITAAERDKRSIDPTLRPRYEQLLAAVTAKRKDASVGATN